MSALSCPSHSFKNKIEHRILEHLCSPKSSMLNASHTTTATLSPSRMESAKFSIPAEFQSQVRYSPCADTRTDAEILAALDQHVPVTSERNVWAFWHSGLQTMPEWCQLNLCNWVRLNNSGRGDGPSSTWTIRVLDSVPDSPNHALKFIPDGVRMPECFRAGTMDGEYVGAHSADFVRGACLYAHGGIWSDVGQVAFLDFDRIGWKVLEDDSNPYRVFAPSVNNGMIANYFLAARKGDPFIKRWHEVFCTLWEGRTNYKGVTKHPLMANLGIDWANNVLFGDSESFDLKVDHITLFEYVAQMVCWVRMTMVEGSSEPDGDKFNGNEYWRNNILLFGSGDETLPLEEATAWKATGQMQADILSTRLDADPESEEYKLAYKVVWRILTSASTQKIAGASMLKQPCLGTIWKRPENKGKDRLEGTFAELLRYGSVNFEQTREHPTWIKPSPKPPSLLKKGALEP